MNIQELIASKKLILTDVDGVLLDWENSFHDWMRTRGYIGNDVNYHYDLHVHYNMQKDEIKEHIVEYNASAWMCCLPPIRDAVEGVKTLSDMGFRFGAITSLSSDPYAAKLRDRNLRELFGDVWEFIICLDTGADKDKSLAPYKGSGLYWIEDKVENSALGADLGLNSLLMRHSYNSTFVHEGVKSVDNWAQIVEIIS
jgi:hypothetical protein